VLLLLNSHAYEAQDEGYNSPQISSEQLLLLGTGLASAHLLWQCRTGGKWMRLIKPGTYLQGLGQLAACIPQLTKGSRERREKRETALDSASHSDTC